MKLLKIILILAALIAVSSCKGIWLMYDTSQVDHIYFQEPNQTHIRSFALIVDDTIHVSTTVYLMGLPSDVDRTFDIAYVDAPEGATLSAGSVTYPVVSARPEVDFSVGNLVIPAGEVSSKLDITLYRQAVMLDSCYVRVGLQLIGNDNFAPLATDSSRTSAIISPYFYVYVNDGDPVCPSWWRSSTSKPLGWHYNLGNYYPEKYRRMLDFFHQTEETCPTFYETCVDMYGKNLDDPNEAYGAAATLMNTFWRKTYSSAWAKYVFIPLYNYYKDYYKDHPEDPHAEIMGTVNINAQTGWGDPMDGTYGFFN